MIRHFAPILIVGAAVVVLGLQQRRSCRAAERAVLLEFPQYAPIGQGPERDEGGGCAVFYDTRDKPGSVQVYLVRQLASHGWKIQPSDASRPDVGFSAMRGSYMYSVSAAPHGSASGSNGQQAPALAGTHVAIHVLSGVTLADARVDVEVYSAATLEETREKARAAAAAMERAPAWSDILLAPLNLGVEPSARTHHAAARAAQGDGGDGSASQRRVSVTISRAGGGMR